MCSLNTQIRVEARIYGIPNCKLIELDEEYHRVFGNHRHPKDFRDLLEVVM